MTFLIGTIQSSVDEDTFDIIVERSGGPYASAIRSKERIRMVNREVNALRPEFNSNLYQRSSLIGRKVYCEVHSRAPDMQLVVTARPM